MKRAMLLILAAVLTSACGKTPTGPKEMGVCSYEPHVSWAKATDAAKALGYPDSLAVQTKVWVCK